MNYPQDLSYTRDHLWIKENGDTLLIGVSDYAQDQLGDILFVDMPEAGASFEAGETFLTIESAKTASDISLPFPAEIVAVNTILDDSPEAINENAYEAWIVEVKTTAAPDGLISASEYESGL